MQEMKPEREEQEVIIGHWNTNMFFFFFFLLSFRYNFIQRHKEKTKYLLSKSPKTTIRYSNEPIKEKRDRWIEREKYILGWMWTAHNPIYSILKRERRWEMNEIKKININKLSVKLWSITTFNHLLLHLSDVM